jgi:fructose-1,6-bisphosphatase/inositol monophosphatase family enzyme
MVDVAPPADVIERVADLIKEVSASVIETRFVALTEADVREKSPGELVTDADEEGERQLTVGLETLWPGVPVVGEESCAADPTLLDALGEEWAWLVDPVDGTANFIAGSPEWAVMVALQYRSETVMSWIWQPVHRRMYVAERGSGATLNRASLTIAPRTGDDGALRGAVLRRFLDAETLARIDANAVGFAAVTTGRMCTGTEYPAIIEGHQDFALFWRTLPWDHAPPVLLLEEAGGTARRPDGSTYHPGDTRAGLLVAANDDVWARAVHLLD